MGTMEECLDPTSKNCLQASSGQTVVDPVIKTKEIQWLEVKVLYGFRTWHIMFLTVGTLLGVIILLCCCFKFRIPRTKQEIEGDHIRRKILRKFRRRLKTIQNQELDDMDLKKALDKIREEFKSDSESLAQSENERSIDTGSSSAIQGIQHPHPRPPRRHSSSTYRRASQIAIDISMEDLRAHSRGFGGRFLHALSRLFGRSKVSQTESNPISSLPLATQTHKTDPAVVVGAEPKGNTKVRLPSKASAVNLATGIAVPSGSKVVAETSSGVEKSKNKKSAKKEKTKISEIKKEEKKRKEKDEKKTKEKDEKKTKGKEDEGVPVTVKIENEKSKTTKPKELKLTSSKKEKVKPDEISKKQKVEEKKKEKDLKAKEKVEKEKEKVEKEKEKVERAKEKAKEKVEKVEKSKEKVEKSKEKVEKSKEKVEKPKDKVEKATDKTLKKAEKDTKVGKSKK